MKSILNRLINQEVLSKEEAKNVLLNIANSKYKTSEIASFITIYLMRSISVEELIGFKEALLELCIKIDFSEYNTIDLCGTGGDGKETFNISTLASFVVAGAGYKVAKHSNYGLSSISGSSTVMENLGVKLTNNISYLKQSMEQSNIAILHAPLFHPALKTVAPVRKELGIKTFFNILGPMVNPSNPKNQLVGVFNLELMRIYSYLYQNTSTNYYIIHSLDGYDEISLTSNTKIISNNYEKLISAADFDIDKIKYEDIKANNTPNEAAKLFFEIISGNGTKEQNNVVCVNAALAISLITQEDLLSSFERAKESLKSMKALEKLTSLQKLSNRFK